MNKLDIDNRGNVIIYNEEKVSSISFLLEDFFDNNLAKLKSDIEVCQDARKKDILIQIAEKYENGELDFISEYWQNYYIEYNSINPLFEFSYNRDGTGEFIAHNVIAIHSGFWYAADNLDKEIKNIVRYRHNYEGFKIAVDKIDIVISIIKGTFDEESAITELQKLGLTHDQAEALMTLNLRIFTAYDTNDLINKISICDKLVPLLRELLAQDVA